MMKGFLISLAIHAVVLTLTFGVRDLNILKVVDSEPEQVFSVILKVNEQEIEVIQKEVKKALKKRQKKIVKKVVKKTPPPQKKISQVAKPKSVKNNGKLKNAYLNELRRFIESKKFYPRMAARLKHSGVVEIALVLDENGNFKDIKIKKASSFETLNDAALDLIKSLKKFKPIPQDMDNTLAVNIPLKYSL